MAQVSTGSFNTSSAEGRYLKFNWSVDNTSIKDNYKEIYWSLVGAGVGGYVIGGNFKVVIDGETVYNNSTRREIWVGTVIASGYKKIYHNTNGTRSFSASVEAGIYEVAVNCTGSGSWELPTIPRTANITSFTVSQRDETSVLFNYTTDSVCDYAWYSADNGSSWHDLPNTNIVSGLVANTSYQFKLRVRRKDTQLTADSSAYAQTTYSYPYCNDSPDFIIGDPLTLGFYNPLGREITVTGYAKSNGAQIFAGKTTGKSLTGFNTNDANGGANVQYASIPNAKSGAYKVVVNWANTTMTRDVGSVYKIRGNEYPTINAFDYIDSNASVVAITGDETKIVQNKSILQPRFHTATANYGAGSITSYTIECNGITKNYAYAGSFDIGTIDSARDVELKLTVCDSRGLTASKTIPVQMVAHESPKATVDLQRLNNYENETYLTVDGTVSDVLGQNTMMIQYRYKAQGGSYGEFTTINDRAKQTLSLDKNNVYVFNVVVTDRFGSTFDGEFTLNKGVFPLFIDTVKNSVGINCFPMEENSLEVNGFNMYNLHKCEKSILLTTGAGLKITIDSFGAIPDKITLIISGADNASVTPVFKVIRIKKDGGWGELNLGLNSEVTVSGNSIHVFATQWSYFTVKAPLGCEISLSNSAL